MTPAQDFETSSAVQPSEARRPSARIRRVFSGLRELAQIVYRDPELVAERLTLYASGQLGDASRAGPDWRGRALAPVVQRRPA